MGFFDFVGKAFTGFDGSPKQLYFLYIDGERSPHSSVWSRDEDLEQVMNAYIWENACNSIEVIDSRGEVIFVWVKVDENFQT